MKLSKLKTMKTNYSIMKRINILPLLTLLLLVSSCNKWLDVTPQGQIEAKEILSDERGFNYAVSGIYLKLGSSSLYGRNLFFGHIDALAQYYDFGTASSHTYKAIAEYDFEDSGSVSFFNTLWTQYYQAIAQVNEILPHLEENRANIERADLFEGELYGLRAFMHFELLKYFAPAIRTEADLNKAAIPYRVQYNNVATEFNTIKEVIDFIRADLQKAAELLENDPIITYGREADINDNMLEYSHILKRRGTRMNYYAVLGLMARLYMWEGDKANALIYAERVIEEAKENIELTDDMGVDNDLIRDIVCQSEYLFALHDEELYENVGVYWGINDKSVNSSSSNLLFKETYYDQTILPLYTAAPDGAGTDNRIKFWFGVHPDIDGEYQFIKLQAPLESNTIPPVAYWPEIPIMKLSEMYYIACEALIGVNSTKALEYLEAVRASRGLVALEDSVNDTVLMDYLAREMRKDFFGEGIMYSFYKRTFRPIDTGSETFEPFESMYLFPIPDAEYEFSPNLKPESDED